MRFYLEALRHVLTPKPPFGLPAKLAAGAVALAVLVVIYGAVSGGDEIPADAVAVTGPVFTPVALTPPAPSPAIRPSEAKRAPPPQFDDDVAVTRAVQAELKRAGCYGGLVNGVWTPATRRAMAEFTRRVNARLPVDRADPVLLALLQAHAKVSCADACDEVGDAACSPPSVRSEVAGVEKGEPEERRAEPRTASTAEAPPSADDLGVSPEGRHAPNPIASVQTASAEDDDSPVDEAAVAAAAAAAPKVAKPRTARKSRKKSSLSRQVSKGFRQIQRTLNSLF